jgi:hypothetical protein
MILQEPHNKKPSQILRHTHQRRHNTPCDRQRGQPELGTRALEHDVAGQFEEDVTDEVEGKAGEILVAGHVEVGCEALDAGVCNCFVSAPSGW